MELLPGAYNSTAAGLELPQALANGSAALSERQQYAIGLFLSCLYTIFLFPIGFVAPWTVAHEAALSLEFSRQEYWSGLLGSSQSRD